MSPLQLSVQIIGNRKPYVEPNQITHLEGSHRMTVAKLHRLVDVFGRRHPSFHHAHCLEPEHHAQAG